MPDDLRGVPDELAWELSVFVGLPSVDGRYPYLRVGHSYKEVGMLSERVREHSELVREPDSQGGELCP
jgi:hypothetical protein